VIEATLYTDPGCPWAYSANPALRVLEWRFREQLSWRLVTIGLRERPSDAAIRTFDAQRSLSRWRVYEERYGMPFGSTPKARATGTGRGCRAVIAAGMLEPGSEWQVLRALQLANFTTDLCLDDTESIRAALEGVSSIEAQCIAERIDADEVVAEYERQLEEARSAAGTPADAQGKTATAAGRARFTAPSLVFSRNGESVVAGGWQPLLAYDVLLANLEPTLERVPPPESPEPLLAFFPFALTTAEVALLLAEGPDPFLDLALAEALLGQVVEAGNATREPLGGSALWTLEQPLTAGAGAEPEHAQV
jgi:protein-disulfide isomerase-like protein with CxxC motif